MYLKYLIQLIHILDRSFLNSNNRFVAVYISVSTIAAQNQSIDLMLQIVLEKSCRTLNGGERYLYFGQSLMQILSQILFIFEVCKLHFRVVCDFCLCNTNITSSGQLLLLYFQHILFARNFNFSFMEQVCEMQIFGTFCCFEILSFCIQLYQIN